MPKIKREVKETSEVDSPQEEVKPHPAEMDLWDYLNSLKDTDFMDGDRRVREFWIYQLEPSVTRKEGEPANAGCFSERFTPETLRSIDPTVKRWRIIEKILGNSQLRRTWYISMKPSAQPGVGGAPALLSSGGGDGNSLKDVRELLRDGQEAQRQAMTSSVQIIGAAHQKAVEMIPRPGSMAEELVKLKEAGLLQTAGSGFDTAKIEVILEKGITILDRLGLIRKPSENQNPQLEQLTALLDFAEDRFGHGMGKRGGDLSPWNTVLQTVAPAVVKGVQEITSNIMFILDARARMAGVQLPVPPAANGQQPVSQPHVAHTAPTVAPPVGATPPPSNGSGAPPVMSAQDFIKIRFVELCQKELAEQEPDAENIANWLDMTAPQLAELFTNNTEQVIFAFLDADPILARLGNDEKTVSFKNAILKSLKEPAVAA